MAAELMVSARKSLMLTDASSADLVWCLSKVEKERVIAASRTFVKAVKAAVAASKDLEMK